MNKDFSRLKDSVQGLAKHLASVVEEKLGDRSQLEEQVRGVAKQVEKVINENLGGLGLRRDSQVVVKVKTLENFKGDLPKYETVGASGLDVRASLDAPLELKPGERHLIPTGLSFAIPQGYEIQVRPRSGLAIKKGLTMVNTPGTVDADYRGEVKIIAINLGQESITIQDQERVAQLVVCPVIQAHFEKVDDLEATERGAGGFGSTGQ